jgi:hypothetical protein
MKGLSRGDAFCAVRSGLRRNSSAVPCVQRARLACLPKQGGDVGRPQALLQAARRANDASGNLIYSRGNLPSANGQAVRENSHIFGYQYSGIGRGLHRHRLLGPASCEGHCEGPAGISFSIPQKDHQQQRESIHNI